MARLKILAAFLLLTATIAESARAELAALVVDRGEGSLRVVAVDSSDGGVTPGSVAIADCCLLGAGLTAADADGERFFAFGRESTADEDRLATLAFDGSSAGTVVPARAPQVLLAYDGMQDRLISVALGGSAASPTLQWFSLDPSTGAASDIGPTDATCCELMTGVADVDAAGQRLFFVGRAFGQSDWRIRSLDLASGDVTDVGPMPAAGRPGFLRYSDAGGHLDVYMQNGPNGADDGFYRVDPGTGSGILVADEDDGGCCLLGLGHIASLDDSGEAWWLAGSGAGMTPTPGFMSLFAESGNGSVSERTIDAGYALHALVVDGQVVSPGLIFSDRFEAGGP
jgi:hypothetical protein